MHGLCIRQVQLRIKSGSKIKKEKTPNIPLMFFPHVSAHRLDARPEKNGKKGEKLNMQKISESEKPRQMRARFLRPDCKKRKIGEVGQICKNERCKMRERPTPQRPAKESPSCQAGSAPTALCRARRRLWKNAAVPPFMKYFKCLNSI